MKMTSLSRVSVGFPAGTVAGAAKGGCPKQRTDRTPSLSARAPNRSEETTLDSLSYGLMEGRYGIQEEGFF